MKDYSAMSDFEINKAVDDILHPPKPRHVKAYNSNYCNNPADAWHIITANKITIIACADKWIAVPIGSIIDGDTSENESMMYCNSFSNAHGVSDVNPLRAAMIVYLQMMEQK